MFESGRRIREYEIEPRSLINVLLFFLLGIGLHGCRTNRASAAKGVPPTQILLLWAGRTHVLPADLKGMAASPFGVLKAGDVVPSSLAPSPDAAKAGEEEFLLDPGRRVLIARGRTWAVPEGFPGPSGMLDLWVPASGEGQPWLGEGRPMWRMEGTTPHGPDRRFSAIPGSHQADGVGERLTAESAMAALKGVSLPEGRLKGNQAKIVSEWLKDGVERLHQAIRVPFRDGSSWWFVNAGVYFGRFGGSIVLRTTAQGEVSDCWSHEWSYEGRNDNTWWIQPEGAFAVVDEGVLVLDFQGRTLVWMPGFAPFNKNPYAAGGGALNLTYEPGAPVRAGNRVISALAPDRFHVFRMPSGSAPPTFLRLFRVPPRFRHASGTSLITVDDCWVMWRTDEAEWVAWDPQQDSLHVWAKGAAVPKG